MYFYHGNKHYYLTRIFLGDQELRDIIYANGLVGKYEDLSYALADQLYTEIDKSLIDNDLSAIEFYDNEYENYQKNSSYISTILLGIQTAIYSVYDRQFPWYQKGNKGLYVAILKSLIYGSIKHFFFENRDKYLPQYDWYLINQNIKRKDIVEMLFREFDKLANVGDALKYYQDPDDIPLEFLIYLQEITGLTMNNYGNIFTQLQLRSLTKHLMDIWREKGAIFSIELFFACMGIQCDISELWFDRRLYYSPSKFNDYTNVQDPKSFGYYLTPLKPHTISYEFSSENIDYADYTYPCSSRNWDYKVRSSSDPDIIEILLGIKDIGSEEATYTFFKSNYLLINFSYIGQNRSVSKDELDTYKELIEKILPVFIRTYYGNEYASSYGGDQYDIFKWYDPSTDKDKTTGTAMVYDNETNSERPAEIFNMFDTALDPEKYEWPDGSKHDVYLYDAYLSVYVGKDFTSGTRLFIYDTRLSQYLSDNNIENPESLNELATSPSYDMIGAGQISDLFYNEYPVFYNQDNEYKWGFKKTTDTNIVADKDYYVYNSYNDVFKVQEPKAADIGSYYELDQTVLIDKNGTQGTLEITITNDISDPINKTNSPGEETTYHRITRYYFKVNNDEKVEIYPILFVENNNNSRATKNEGTDQDESFNEPYEQQIDWAYETFDPKYTDKAQNLFESSSWTEDIKAFNDLYNGNVWNGHIEYEYSQYTNPLLYIDIDIPETVPLNEQPITITLI